MHTPCSNGTNECFQQFQRQWFDDEVQPSYDEIYDKYLNMLGKFEKLAEKYKPIKKMDFRLKKIIWAHKKWKILP